MKDQKNKFHSNLSQNDPLDTHRTLNEALKADAKHNRSINKTFH